MFRSIRGNASKVNARVNNLAPGYVLTPLTKKVHQIDNPEEPSKATGFVLPWTPIEHVVEACGRCAVDEGTDGTLCLPRLRCISKYLLQKLILLSGRSCAIMPSGVIDLEEDFATGYGGQKTCEVLENEGITALFPALFPK